MGRNLRWWTVFAAVSVGLSAAAALVMSAYLSVAAPLLTPTPTVTPTQTTEFSATLRLNLSDDELRVGDYLTASVSLTVSEGCQYPVYELKLTQSGPGAPAFEYIDPPSDTVGPGVPMPFRFLLKAVRPGTVTFVAQTYGERYCNDFWQWRYLTATVGPSVVRNWPHRVWLPVVRP